MSYRYYSQIKEGVLLAVESNLIIRVVETTQTQNQTLRRYLLNF